MGINHLLRQTITIKNPTGTRDLHGKAALGASTSVRARFQRGIKTIVTAEREREPIHGMVFVMPSTDVDVGAQVVYEGTKYRVLERADIPGRNGQIHHRELMLQLWSWPA